MSRTSAIAVAMAILVLVPAASCGNADDSGAPPAAKDRSEFVAQVASYELVAGVDNRFLAAMAGNGTGTVVSFGQVDLRFSFLGTEAEPVDPPAPGPEATATFMPIAGQAAPDPGRSAEEVRPSAGVGVYRATGVRFDRAGFWRVVVRARLGGEDVSAAAAFPVFAAARLPAPGQPAPRTANPIGGASGVAPVAIDSRSAGGRPLPDPELHSTSIADALAAGRPTMVVVSTPVYCVSRFCGPVTDSVGALAREFGDRMAFIHLEVWEDFEAKKVNAFAAEWIRPTGGGDMNEPWVFVVGGDGIVRSRFDNVAGDAELRAATEAVLSAP